MRKEQGFGWMQTAEGRDAWRRGSRRPPHVVEDDLGSRVGSAPPGLQLSRESGWRGSQTEASGLYPGGLGAGGTC